MLDFCAYIFAKANPPPCSAVSAIAELLVKYSIQQSDANLAMHVQDPMHSNVPCVSEWNRSFAVGRLCMRRLLPSSWTTLRAVCHRM